MKEALSGPIYRGTAYLRSKLGCFGWGPALAVAKPAVLSLFSSVEVGSILLVDEPADQRYHFGQKHEKNSNWNVFDEATRQADVACPTCVTRQSTAVPPVELVVKSNSFWTRLFLFADMGFAEAYMLGEVECTDLTSFFKFFILNRDRIGNGSTWSSIVTSAISRLARSANTLSNSLLNASAHYDISNDMFVALLSPDMTYSCPIWQPLQSGVKVRETLEQAQMTKLRRFIQGARIKATDHVLEIGSGWGSFAIEAVRMTGCRVTTLTLSREQKALAEKRIAEAWCSNRIQVLLADYRELPVPETPYDKIISIEMLEAVGREYLGTYFACVNRLLKKDGGIAMFQCITMPEGRHAAYSRTEE
jgi:cyclopropane-fatty-acyl-phospholipid synthase